MTLITYKSQSVLLQQLCTIYCQRPKKQIGSGLRDPVIPWVCKQFIMKLFKLMYAHRQEGGNMTMLHYSYRCFPKGSVNDFKTNNKLKISLMSIISAFLVSLPLFLSLYNK